MGTNTKGNGRMGKGLVKELSPGQMGTNTKGNGRMGKGLVKGNTFFLMEEK